MKKHIFFRNLALQVIFALGILLGCARVSIDAKKPIKLDVTMRLDIYQHVSKDVDAIEDMVSGTEKKEATTGLNKSSCLELGIAVAYAQEEDDMSSEIRAAVDRRRDRREKLHLLESEGVLGESKTGWVEVRGTADAEANALASSENSDRRLIYEHVAKKNGATVDETAEIFAKRIQDHVPAGTPIQSSSGTWTTK